MNIGQQEHPLKSPKHQKIKAQLVINISQIIDQRSTTQKILRKDHVKFLINP